MAKRDKTLAQIGIEGTPLERKAVRSVLLRNFTDDERRQMRGLTIRIVPDLFDSQVGTIAGRWTHRGGTRRSDLIEVHGEAVFLVPDLAGPRKGNPVDDDSITHELIHFLRFHDAVRHISSPASSAKLQEHTILDRDLEETLADAETLVRSRIGPNRKETGYYQFIKDHRFGSTSQAKQVYDKQMLMDVRQNGRARVDPDALDLELERETLGAGTSGEDGLARAGFRASPKTGRYREDRDAVVRRMFQNKRGPQAVKAIERWFPRLAIARMERLGEGAEMIDRFFFHFGESKSGDPKTVSTQLYSPEGELSTRSAARLATQTPLKNATLVEYMDGSPTVRRIPSDKRPVRSGRQPRSEAEGTIQTDRPVTQRELDRRMMSAFGSGPKRLRRS